MYYALHFRESRKIINETMQLGKVHIFWEGHKICEIFTLLLTTVHTVKSKVKILQNLWTLPNSHTIAGFAFGALHLATRRLGFVICLGLALHHF